MISISKVDAHLIIDNLAPISSLPPEILATIFYFVLVEQTEFSPFFPFYYFTHVCRSWRSVALNTPNLWKVLPRDTRWADVVLERSKGADLVVRASLRSPESSSIMFLKGVLANHTSRIRELVLSHVDIRTLDTLIGNLPQSSLRLQSLQLSCFKTVQPTFPIGILDTRILQTLNLECCVIDHWYSLSFPALTSLTLDCVFDRPPLINFLEMLRGVPTLRILIMDKSLPLANDLMGRIGTVHLPNLRRLFLSSMKNPKELTNLLHFIIVPPTTRLELVARLKTPKDVETIAHELASCFSTFFSHLRHDMESLYSHLGVAVDGGHLILDTSKGMITPPCLALDLANYTSLNFVSNLLQRIIPSFPFFTIASLTLDASSLCMDTFGRLPHLQDIAVRGDCTTELIQALSCRREDYNTEPVMSFPALRVLCILEYFLQRTEERTSALEDLECCLMERHERKAGLSKLTFIFCDLRAKDVKRLRKFVDEVDGVPP